MPEGSTGVGLVFGGLESLQWVGGCFRFATQTLVLTQGFEVTWFVECISFGSWKCKGHRNLVVFHGSGVSRLVLEAVGLEQSVTSVLATYQVTGVQTMSTLFNKSSTRLQPSRHEALWCSRGRDFNLVWLERGLCESPRQ